MKIAADYVAVTPDYFPETKSDLIIIIPDEAFFFNT